MKTIKLTQGYEAMVDDEDFERVNAFKWTAAVRKLKTMPPLIYAASRQGYLHRFILGCTGRVDHEDGNGLNCQRFNLRPCTQSQNGANKRKYNGASKYKGVSWHAKLQKWQVHIKVRGTKMHLGVFSDEADAATVYNFAALEHFGEFALFNQPEVQS